VVGVCVERIALSCIVLLVLFIFFPWVENHGTKTWDGAEELKQRQNEEEQRDQRTHFAQ
jgi:hypothetical protein